MLNGMADGAGNGWIMSVRIRWTDWRRLPMSRLVVVIIIIVVLIVGAVIVV